MPTKILYKIFVSLLPPKTLFLLSVVVVSVVPECVREQGGKEEGAIIGDGENSIMRSLIRKYRKLTDIYSRRQFESCVLHSR
jgi:hypothetical protein